MIPPEEFERCLLKWVNTQVNLPEGEIVALDGKILCGSHNRAKEQDAVEIVSSWAALEAGHVNEARGGRARRFDSVVKSRQSIRSLCSSLDSLPITFRSAARSVLFPQ